MLANNPHPISTPPLNNSTRPTIVLADATAVVPDAATAVAISHNNQPGLVAAELAHSNPLVLLIKNWNYCSTHGGDVEDWHTSATCGCWRLAHNPNATRANIMGGSVT